MTATRPVQGAATSPSVPPVVALKQPHLKWPWLSIPIAGFAFGLIVTPIVSWVHANRAKRLGQKSGKYWVPTILLYTLLAIGIIVALTTSGSGSTTSKSLPASNGAGAAQAPAAGAGPIQPLRPDPVQTIQAIEAYRVQAFTTLTTAPLDDYYSTHGTSYASDVKEINQVIYTHQVFTPYSVTKVDLISASATKMVANVTRDFPVTGKADTVEVDHNTYVVVGNRWYLDAP